MSLRLAALAGGWIGSAILLAACIFLWGRWDHAVLQGRIDVARATAAAADARADAETRVRSAADTYARRTTALQPIILESNKKADDYAQTPAGRAPCLALDRVQSILADRTALFADTPGGGAGPVPAGGDPAGATQQR